jgi:TIR domain
MNPPLSIFISYAPEDTHFRDAFTKHLAGLRRSGKVTIWSDNQISLGTIWNEETKKHLQQADIVALLISEDFIASDHLWDTELKESLGRREKGESVMLLPILVRPCVIKNTVLENIQGLPRSGQAVSLHASQDEAWSKIALEMNELVDKFQQIVAETIHSNKKHIPSEAVQQIIGSKNVISGSVIIVGGNLVIGDGHDNIPNNNR